jgi:transcriptional regulator with XRE-family HTH domain
MSPAKSTELAAFIAARRRERGLSLRQVAESMGVSKSNIYYWESGKVRPKAGALEKLADVLGVSAADLFTLAGYTQPEGLPSVAPYLRTRYGHLPEAAVEEAEAFFRDLESRYGGADGDDA